jgi:hypothetical protein
LIQRDKVLHFEVPHGLWRHISAKIKDHIRNIIVRIRNIIVCIRNIIVANTNYNVANTIFNFGGFVATFATQLVSQNLHVRTA